MIHDGYEYGFIESEEEWASMTDEPDGCLSVWDERKETGLVSRMPSEERGGVLGECRSHISFWLAVDGLYWKCMDCKKISSYCKCVESSGKRGTTLPDGCLLVWQCITDD